MRRTQDQKRFTISEVAADWRELLMLEYVGAMSIYQYLSVLLQTAVWCTVNCIIVHL